MAEQGRNERRTIKNSLLLCLQLLRQPFSKSVKTLICKDANGKRVDSSRYIVNIGSKRPDGIIAKAKETDMGTKLEQIQNLRESKLMELNK
jgi:hypothetical protein